MIFKVCLQPQIVLDREQRGFTLNIGDNYHIDDNTGRIRYRRHYKKTGKTFLKVEVKKLTGSLKACVDRTRDVERALFFGTY